MRGFLNPLCGNGVAESAACCIIADLKMPGADWAVEKCSALRAMADLADSPT